MSNHKISKCLNCNGTSFAAAGDGTTEFSGISKVTTEGGNHNIALDNFIPVRAYVCNSCSYVMLFHNKP